MPERLEDTEEDLEDEDSSLSLISRHRGKICLAIGLCLGIVAGFKIADRYYEKSLKKYEVFKSQILDMIRGAPTGGYGSLLKENVIPAFIQYRKEGDNIDFDLFVPEPILLCPDDNGPKPCPTKQDDTVGI